MQAAFCKKGKGYDLWEVYDTYMLFWGMPT